MGATSGFASRRTRDGPSGMRRAASRYRTLSDAICGYAMGWREQTLSLALTLSRAKVTWRARAASSSSTENNDDDDTVQRNNSTLDNGKHKQARRLQEHQNTRSRASQMSGCVAGFAKA